MTKNDSIRNSNVDGNVSDGTDSDTNGPNEKLISNLKSAENLEEVIRELEKEASDYGTGK